MLLALGMHLPNRRPSVYVARSKSLLIAACLLSGLSTPQAGIAAASWQSATLDSAREPGLATLHPSADVRRVAEWVRVSGDNHGLSFVIVDKIGAELFLFDAGGSVRAATPVLLGVARGDDSPAGIGNRKLSMITPAERITPAGRFVAAPGRNLAGQDIVWVDYAAAISLHRATDKKPGMSSQSRADRLASATTRDNRASYGCINVSVDFYDRFIRAAFNGTTGIVYVLPETRSVSDEFHIPTAGATARGDTSPAKPGA